MLDKIKNLFKRPEPPKIEAPKKEKKPRKPREKKVVPQLSEKDLATQRGEPYIKITEMELDPNNISSGSLTFDWNDKFILNLIRAGYKMKPEDTDAVMVDRWFQQICRNIALEVYEQQAADPEKRADDDLRTVRTRDIGNGRTEVS